MNLAGKIFFICLVIGMCIGGCLGIKHPETKIHYYTLEYDAPEMVDLQPLPYIIHIERFSVSPLYNSNRMNYSSKPFIRDAYHYHKWQVNPGDLVTHYLKRDFQQSDLFKAVFSHANRFSSSHVIEGTVDKFFELDGQDLWEAVLSVGITLIAANEQDIKKRILFQKKYGIKEACSKKTPQAVAEAMSKAMARISEMIQTDIHRCLEMTK